MTHHLQILITSTATVWAFTAVAFCGFMGSTAGLPDERGNPRVPEHWTHPYWAWALAVNWVVAVTLSAWVCVS